MKYNSTIFLTLDDFNNNYNIITVSNFDDIEKGLWELFLNPLLFKPSEEVVSSLFDKICEEISL